MALGLGTPKRLSLVPLKRGVQGQDMDMAMGKWELVQHVMCSAKTEKDLVPNWHLKFHKTLEEIAVKCC